MYTDTYIYQGEESSYCGLKLQKGGAYTLKIYDRPQTDFCVGVSADLYVIIQTAYGSAECPYTYDGFNSVWYPI